MTTYVTQEARFDLPEGFSDRSVNNLELRLPDGILRIGVSREPAKSTTLDALVARRERELERRFAFYERLASAPRLAGGLGGFDHKARFREGNDRHIIRSFATMTKGLLLVITVTAPEALDARIDEVFERLLGTLEPRTE